MGKGWDRGPKGGGWGQEEWTPARPAPSARPAPARAVSTGPEFEARVKWFNGEKGFGFVELTDGSGEAFLHIRAVEAAGHTELQPGTTLQVRVGQGQKGPQVTEVLSVDASTATPRRPAAPVRAASAPALVRPEAADASTAIPGRPSPRAASSSGTRGSAASVS